jgi:DNA repair protein RecO (recombination protein O)
MIYKTRGIVLHQIKYQENSIIAYVYTESFGRQAYLVHGVHSKKAKHKIQSLQPLFLLDLEVYKKEISELQKIKEFRNYPAFTTIPFDSTKCTISLFIAEVLYRSLKEEESNPNLFDFLFSSIQSLDYHNNVNNFHIYFLLKFSKYLGFYPTDNYSTENCFFDLFKGSFTNKQPSDDRYIESKYTEMLHNLLNMRLEEALEIPLHSSTRLYLSKKITEFFSLHLDGFGKINSLDVLNSVFH